MPSNTQNTLSPSLMAMLIENVARGDLKVASLVSNVQNDIPVTWKGHSAKMTKRAPGDFLVTMCKTNLQNA